MLGCIFCTLCAHCDSRPLARSSPSPDSRAANHRPRSPQRVRATRLPHRPRRPTPAYERVRQRSWPYSSGWPSQAWPSRSLPRRARRFRRRTRCTYVRALTTSLTTSVRHPYSAALVSFRHLPVARSALHLQLSSSPLAMRTLCRWLSPPAAPPMCATISDTPAPTRRAHRSPRCVPRRDLHRALTQPLHRIASLAAFPSPSPSIHDKCRGRRRLLCLHPCSRNPQPFERVRPAPPPSSCARQAAVDLPYTAHRSA
ncbi:hypothetical protein OBBRIDRAFT_164558 [Obba rivulosa]|uniref:Uncharacterized protein n=1 Tax=Obba rivulosa TaxID=1052685 RepID=A0A8E2DR42_9APHY|nr:hypothetical protein OBBRIDRAFT_164558 [Obba rivulosa]